MVICGGGAEEELCCSQHFRLEKDWQSLENTERMGISMVKLEGRECLFSGVVSPPPKKNISVQFCTGSAIIHLLQSSLCLSFQTVLIWECRSQLYSLVAVHLFSQNPTLSLLLK